MGSFNNIINELTMMNGYVYVLKSTFNFKGRINRIEFWTFILFNLGFFIFCILIDNFIGITISDINQYFIPIGYFSILFLVVTFIPTMSAIMRRLHDNSLSGWLVILALIPYFGAIIIAILLLMKGNKHMNCYGRRRNTI